MRDSTASLERPGALRQEFVDDGYVLLRGVVDRRRVLQLRADYFGRFERAAPAAPYGTRGHPAYDLVRSEHFDRFTRDPRLQTLAETLLNGPAELVPRRIVRHFYRGQNQASRAHADYDYMDQGGDQLLTMWIPLGDYPIECGGLIYLEGSHRLARTDLDRMRPFTDRPADPRPLSNDLVQTVRTLGGRWLWTDYRAGDVVVHSPHIVHASLDDTSDVMRLSADLRFRRLDCAPDERWNDSWSADDGF